jgi:hypothetical protein
VFLLPCKFLGAVGIPPTDKFWSLWYNECLRNPYAFAARCFHLVQLAEMVHILYGRISVVSEREQRLGKLKCSGPIALELKYAHLHYMVSVLYCNLDGKISSRC